MWTVQNLGYYYSYTFLSGVAAVLLTIAVILPDWINRGPFIEGSVAVLYHDGLWKSCRYALGKMNCTFITDLNQKDNKMLMSWTGTVSALMLAGLVSISLSTFDMLRRLWNISSPDHLSVGFPTVLTSVGTISTFLGLEIHTNRALNVYETIWKQNFEFGSGYKLGWSSFVLGLWSLAPLLIQLAGGKEKKKKSSVINENLEPIQAHNITSYFV